MSSECFVGGGHRISENLERVYGTRSFRNAVLDVSKYRRVLNCTLWLLSPRKKAFGPELCCQSCMICGLQLVVKSKIFAFITNQPQIPVTVEA